ncbi:MAG TPA: homoserine O-succinyltransferase [Longimicrobiales bacterium]
MNGTRTKEPGPAAGVAGAGAVPCVSGVYESAAPLVLEHGGALERWRLAYRSYGEERAPAAVVLGGISAGRHLCACADDPQPGWWEEQVGPGRAVDTRRLRAIGVDWLGGRGQSTGAGVPALPPLDTRDQARAIAALLDHLGIARLHAIVGASYGGMVALAFAALFPERVGRVVAIGAAHESHPMATALRALQRRVVRLGLEAGAQREALAIARGIAMTTYRSAAEFAQRFAGAPEWVEAAGSGAGPEPQAGAARRARFPVERYLDHHGRTFASTFPTEGFLRLSESIDLHRVDPAAVRVPVTLVAVDTDTLVPIEQMRGLRAALPGPAELIELRSIYGHDAFLKETAAFARALRRALGTAQAGEVE